MGDAGTRAFRANYCATRQDNMSPRTLWLKGGGRRYHFREWFNRVGRRGIVYRDERRRKNALFVGRARTPDLPAAAKAAVDLDQPKRDLAPRLGPLVLLDDEVLLNRGVTVEVYATKAGLVLGDDHLQR